MVLTSDFVRLAVEHWDEANAMRAHPHQRLTRTPDQNVGEFIVALILGHTHQILHVLLSGQRGEDYLIDLGLREIREYIRAQVFDAVVDETKSAGRKEGVASPLVQRRL